MAAKPADPEGPGRGAELEDSGRVELESEYPELVTREIYELPDEVRRHRVMVGSEADELREEKESGSDSDTSHVDWESPDTIR